MQTSLHINFFLLLLLLLLLSSSSSSSSSSLSSSLFYFLLMNIFFENQAKETLIINQIWLQEHGEVVMEDPPFTL